MFKNLLQKQNADYENAFHPQQNSHLFFEKEIPNSSKPLFETVKNFFDQTYKNNEHLLYFFGGFFEKLSTSKNDLLNCKNLATLKSCLTSLHQKEQEFILVTKPPILCLLLLILKCKAFYGHDKDKYHKELEKLITDNKKPFSSYRWLYRPKIGLDKILKDHPKELIFIFYFSGNPKDAMALCAKYKNPSNAFRCGGGCGKIESGPSKINININKEFEDTLFYIVVKKEDTRFNKFFKP